MASASETTGQPKRLVVLGASGSIGTQTLDVVRSCSSQFQILGLSAHRQWPLLFEQAREFRPRWVTLTDPCLTGGAAAEEFAGPGELLFGERGIERMVRDPDVDLVVAAMVGSSGLRGTLWALESKKSLALANKETLIVGGQLVTELAARNGIELLPIDSEHSAIFQCLQGGRRSEVARIILTASGGPFRTRPASELEHVTVEEALAHPTWRMGPKITIDSATMMNKALEIIEAHWLFGLAAEQIHVVIHPQSIVHSMVEFVDGSVLAQVSPPDMRLPIQYALTYPVRLPCPSQKLDLSVSGRWEFEPPDPDRYPALRLAAEVIAQGGTAGAALNAANEVAVARFLEGEIRFPQIVRLCEEVLAHHPYDPRPVLADLERVDRWARREARSWRRSTPSSVSS